MTVELTRPPSQRKKKRPEIDHSVPSPCVGCVSLKVTSSVMVAIEILMKYASG